MQSRDHTEVQELVAEGGSVRRRRAAGRGGNVVTRAIGVHDDPELEIKDGVLQAGDAFVLCSDGLTAHVEDERDPRAWSSNRGAQQACDALVELTLDARRRRQRDGRCGALSARSAGRATG